MDEYAIELSGVTKRFGDVAANENVDLKLKKGEILSVLGENGSGKTTLMNILSGIYFPDEGTVKINGREVVIHSPRDAFDLGIGMIHQHFKLVEVMTAAENIVLGLPGRKKFDINSVGDDIKVLSDKFGFEIDPSKKIYNMSVSEKQTVEIVKVLYRGADIMILDEPTAVLTPQEIERLFKVLWRMRNSGKSIIIITHKLNEVLEISERVTVLRKGKIVGTVDTSDASVGSLTEMMVGEKVSLDIKRSEPKDRKLRLKVQGVTIKGPEGNLKTDDVSFEAYSGEILGIAGVAGSGQKELIESIAGLQFTEGGSIRYFAPEGNEEELTEKTPDEIRELNIHLAFVPEDRLGMGLVGSMDLTDNMMLRSYKNGGHFFADRRAPKTLAERIVRKLDVVTPGVGTPIRRLSGGNVQKVLVGREISSSPTVLMVAYPVRGLDINSSYTIYNLLNEQKEKGVAVVCVGEDLDVLIDLCDRIMVLCDGKLTGTVDARKTTKEEIGMLMLGGEMAK